MYIHKTFRPDEVYFEVVFSTCCYQGFDETCPSSTVIFHKIIPLGGIDYSIRRELSFDISTEVVTDSYLATQFWLNGFVMANSQ